MRRLVLLPPLVLSLALVVMACGGSDASAPPAGADSTTLSDGAPASVQDGDSGTVAAADVEIVPVPPHSPGLDLGSWCAEHGHTTDSIRAAAASRRARA